MKPCVKHEYFSYADAKKAATRARRKTAEGIQPYRCKHCRGYHIGHTPYNFKRNDRGVKVRLRTTRNGQFAQSDFNGRNEETLTRAERKELARQRAENMRIVAERLMAATPTITFQRSK